MIHLSFAWMFYLMIFCHFLADYPLQGEFLANAKNRNTELGKKYWHHALFAHGMIHGGFVALITGSIWFGIAETVMHMLIDFDKCEGKIDLNTDQFLHLCCKVTWMIFIVALST